MHQRCAYISRVCVSVFHVTVGKFSSVEMWSKDSDSEDQYWSLSSDCDDRPAVLTGSKWTDTSVWFKLQKFLKFKFKFSLQFFSFSSVSVIANILVTVSVLVHVFQFQLYLSCSFSFDYVESNAEAQYSYMIINTPYLLQ